VGDCEQIDKPEGEQPISHSLHAPIKQLCSELVPVV
jgi:hypothetical protein